jgi:hypothetical protein
MAAVVVVALLVNIYFFRTYPVVKTWGDEATYVKLSHQDTTYWGKVGRLVPGNMTFQLWPPFTFSVYGLFASDRLAQSYKDNFMNSPREQVDRDVSAFFARVYKLNVILFLYTAVMIYWISLALRFGKACGIAASCLFLFNLRLLFYVQSAWPEFFHLALFTTAILLLIRFQANDRFAYLIVSGILLGFCSLTKAIVGYYMLILVPILLYHLYRGSRKSISWSAVSIAVFCGAFLIINIPQRLANHFRHDAFAISTNKWINIEKGIIQPARVGQNTWMVYK